MVVSFWVFKVYVSLFVLGIFVYHSGFEEVVCACCIKQLFAKRIYITFCELACFLGFAVDQTSVSLYGGQSVLVWIIEV